MLHARISAIDVAAAKAAPGVLAVLTGADWRASGWGDLPVHGGLKRRDGGAMYRPRYPALVADRVRFVGDYVAFVVAETRAQAEDAAELIEIDYEPLPAVVSTGAALRFEARRWCSRIARTTFASCISKATRPPPTPPLRVPEIVVRQHFVINRVTAVTMEPRGSIGDYNPADGRYTVYTTLQRGHPFRTELAQNVLKVAEAKLRVVAGDIGGSFGMKSAVYNEVPLVLLALETSSHGRPVKWVSTRSEAFLSDAQGRDNVTDAELALDAAGTFLALRVKIIAAVGAYLQTAMTGGRRQSGLARRRLPYPRHPRRCDSRVHQYAAGSALSRQWPAGGRLCDRAHGRSRCRPAGHRSSRIAAAQYDPAGGDAVQDRAYLHL